MREIPQVAPSAPCPCGGATFETCCAPFLRGAPPPTAEACMRSRYTAHVLVDLDHLVRTTTMDVDLDATRDWAEGSVWTGLDVLDTSLGSPDHDRGQVEFRASYERDGQARTHHELAHFVRRDGGYLYTHGQRPAQRPVVAEARVGRNDPCPCGSGRKFKKCHGAPGAAG